MEQVRWGIMGAGGIARRFARAFDAEARGTGAGTEGAR